MSSSVVTEFDLFLYSSSDVFTFILFLTSSSDLIEFALFILNVFWILLEDFNAVSSAFTLALSEFNVSASIVPTPSSKLFLNFEKELLLATSWPILSIGDSVLVFLGNRFFSSKAFRKIPGDSFSLFSILFLSPC